LGHFGKFLKSFKQIQIKAQTHKREMSFLRSIKSMELYLLYCFEYRVIKPFPQWTSVGHWDSKTDISFLRYSKLLIIVYFLVNQDYRVYFKC